MRRIVIGLIVLVLAIPLCGSCVLRRQAHTLSETLIADADALSERHVDLPNAPRVGVVFDCLGPEADAAPDISRVLAWSDPTIIAVTSGSAPFSSLDETQRTTVDDAQAWLLRTFECGSRSRIAPTDGIGPFPDIRHGRRQSMPRLMEALASIAPLTFRRALEQGDADFVLDHCPDVLVLTIGWLRLEGLEGMLPTMGPSRSVLAMCGEARPLASADAKARFDARVPDLRLLAPGYGEVMRLERTQLALRLFGAWIPPDLDVKLPAEARLGTKLQRDSKWDRGVVGTLALRLYWRRFDTGMRQIEDACTLAPALRDASIVRSQAQLKAPFLSRFFTSEPVDLRYEMYAAYVDSLHARLSLLP